MKKSELIKYLNANTKGRKAGRKEFRVNDIFISSSNDDKNFRLTRFGKDVIEKHFKAYNVELQTKETEVGAKLIAIDKYMVSPFFLKNSTLVVYEQTVAAELLLLEGDFDLWIENKS